MGIFSLDFSLSKWLRGVMAAWSAGFKFWGLKVRSPSTFLSRDLVDWVRSLLSWQKFVIDDLRLCRVLSDSWGTRVAEEFDGFRILRRADGCLGYLDCDID